MMISDQITIFESIFRRLYFEHPMDAASYYVALVTREFPSTLKSIALEANNTYPLLLRGRMELLEKGYIAKIINLDDETVPAKKGELYLPVNPILIGEELQDEQARAFDEEEVKRRNELIEQTGRFYNQNFGDYGVGIIEKNITIFYSGRWFFYALVNNLNRNHHVDMMIGRLGSFKEPFMTIYRRMLEEFEGLHLRILYNFPIGRVSKEDQDRMQKSLDGIERLKKKYPDNIEFMSSLVPHSTTRRIIFNHGNGTSFMAIDGRKLLDRDEPSYIGTIYLDKDSMLELKYNFEEAWSNTVECSAANAETVTKSLVVS